MALKILSGSVEFGRHQSSFGSSSRKNCVVSNSLQELTISFDEHANIDEKLEAMIRGLQTFAPSLTTLCFQLVEPTDEHNICLLSGLWQHPSLKTLQLERLHSFEQNGLSSLKQQLGNKVQFAAV